jgi:hypothetical protein
MHLFLGDFQVGGDNLWLGTLVSLSIIGNYLIG